MTFKEFLNQAPQGMPSQTPTPATKKLWSASKDEIFPLWKSLKETQPINMIPMYKGENKGKRSYGEDGIRITGTWDFVLSIIARLKDIMNYENTGNRLRLIFKGVDPTKNPHPNIPSYVFYINLEKRGTGKRGRKS